MAITMTIIASLKYLAMVQQTSALFLFLVIDYIFTASLTALTLALISGIDRTTVYLIIASVVTMTGCELQVDNQHIFGSMLW